LSVLRPREWVCGWAKNFDSALLQPARSVSLHKRFKQWKWLKLSIFLTGLAAMTKKTTPRPKPRPKASSHNIKTKIQKNCLGLEKKDIVSRLNTIAFHKFTLKSHLFAHMLPITDLTIRADSYY